MIASLPLERLHNFFLDQDEHITRAKNLCFSALHAITPCPTHPLQDKVWGAFFAPTKGVFVNQGRAAILYFKAARAGPALPALPLAPMSTVAFAFHPFI